MRVFDKEMKKILNLAKNEQWGDLLKILPDDLGSDIFLLRIAGCAYGSVGRSTYDYNLMEKAVFCLMKVFNHGKSEPEDFWILNEILYDTGRQEDCVPILQKYIETVIDPDERVKAGSFLAMVFDVLNDQKAAVNAFQKALSCEGEMADQIVKFNSFLNGHVLNSHCGIGAGYEWMSSCLELWEKIDKTSLSEDMSWKLLHGVNTVIESDPHDKVKHYIGLKLIKQLFNSKEPWKNSGLIYIHLYRFYLLTGQDKKAETTLNKLRQKAESFYNKALREDGTGLENKEAAFTLLANIAMLINLDDGESLKFMLMANDIKPRPNGPHSFWLAGMILQNNGVKKDALDHLRNVAKDRRWGYGGMCIRPQEIFYKHPAFKSVRELPEFIEVIESLRNEILSS